MCKCGVGWGGGGDTTFIGVGTEHFNTGTDLPGSSCTLKVDCCQRIEFCEEKNAAVFDRLDV